jgi:hypothetical protein
LFNPNKAFLGAYSMSRKGFKTKMLPVEPSAFLERDGSFRFHVPIDIGISCGDYVMLSSEQTFLGQVDVTSFDLVKNSKDASISILGFGFDLSKAGPQGYYLGAGRILAEIINAHAQLEFDCHECVGSISIEPASFEDINSYFKTAYLNKDPLLPVGTLSNLKKSLRISLLPNGFKRPTGFFGQTGSGKSFALAILLEELHLKTSVNIVVLDFNGDFIHIKEPLRNLKQINHKSNKYIFKEREIREYHSLHNRKKELITVLSVDPSLKADSINLKLCDLNAGEQSLLLGLDPIEDREEYYALSQIIDEISADNQLYGIEDLLEYCDSKRSGRFKRERSKLLRRIINLGLDDLQIWGRSKNETTMLADLLTKEELQTLIIDLSTLTKLEQSIISMLVFRKLWDRQIKRKRKNVAKPCLLLIDEAHNLFPVKSSSREQNMTLTQGIKIAGEGRKFGLYLMISSQLPSKIHEHVLSQCGNIILMKMLSQSDIAAIQDSFSFISETILQMPKYFRIGDALVMGKIIPSPCFIHFEGRKTSEGGKDIEVSWK